MISVIIATTSRATKIISCVQSIFRNTYANFEIIIIDQSDDMRTAHVVEHIADARIQYIRSNIRGKSRAINIGIRKSSGSILAFTDDDCIVHKNWLSTIQKSFLQSPQIAATFGNTYPYKPGKRRGVICPSVFRRKNKKIITQPCVHYKHIGFGNNMAIRKNAIEQVGAFKTWLGPGSIGSNAEDAEIALRLLIRRQKILHNPDMIVYHNKWLTKKEMAAQSLSYVCGEMACYGYFYFSGYPFAAHVVRNNIMDSCGKIKQIGKHILFMRWRHLTGAPIFTTLQELYWRIRGLLIGFIAVRFDPIQG